MSLRQSAHNMNTSRYANQMGNIKPKTTNKPIRYIIRQLKKCRDAKTVSGELYMAQRHIRILWGGSSRNNGWRPTTILPLQACRLQNIFYLHA